MSRRIGLLDAGLQEAAEDRARARSVPLEEVKHDEWARMQDRGCEQWAACLTCPFEECRYGKGRIRNRRQTKERDERVIDLRRRGASIACIAGTVGISRRSVFRILAEARGEAHAS